jgi:hypothetical protein
MKHCKQCGVTIPLKRTQLGYSDCVTCSNVEPYGSVNIINHKTGNTVQPMPLSQAKAINKMGDRKRFGTILKGGSKNNNYNPKNVKHQVPTVFVGSEASYNQVGEESTYLLEEKGYDFAIQYIDNAVNKYIINKSQGLKIKRVLTALNEIKS